MKETDSKPAKKTEHVIRSAHYDDLDNIQALLEPFVQQRKLLRRLESEFILLMANGFVAEPTVDGTPTIVCFASL